MGLTSLLLGPTNPLSMFVGANKNTIRGIGAGLASRPTFQEGLSAGAHGAAYGAQVDDQEAIRQQQINDTAQQKNATIQAMLEAGREDLANMAEAGQMDLAWKAFLEAKQGGKDATMGLTPVWGTDAQGNPVMGQMSNQGGVQMVEPPQGVTFGKDPIRIDAGNQIILLDPVTRQPIGQIPKSGDVPTGYEQSPQGGIAPMRGSEQDVEATGRRIKADSAMSALEQKNQVAMQAIDTALDQANPMTTGNVMGNTGWVPFLGQGAQDLGKTLDTIKANIGFEELQTMRDNSPTGGALGQVTERELAFLQATIANIEQSQSEEQLKQNLQILRDFLAQSQARRRAAFQQEYGGGRQAPGGTTSGGVSWSIE